MKILTRSEAKTLGLTQYFTGKPCPLGHIANRRVSSKGCTKCLAIGSREAIRSWHRDNKKMLNARKRAARNNAEGCFSADDIQQLYYDQGGLCYCGKTLYPQHVDHIIPISRGGSNWPENLQLLCQPCNDSKGTRTMDEWSPTYAA